MANFSNDTREFMLRTLHFADIDHLLCIEKAVHVAPWNRDAFTICLKAGGIGWVIEKSKQIVGFIIMAIGNEECHILNLSVAREHQAQGLGFRLLNQGLQYAKQQKMIMAYLEVRRSNAPAIKLYKKMDFSLIGERKNYYMTVAGFEDALIFAKNLSKD